MKSKKMVDLIIAFSILSLLYLFKITKLLSVVGLVFILALFSIFFIQNFKKVIKFNKTIIIGLMLIAYVFISMFRDITLESFYTGLQMIFLILFAISFYQIKFNQKEFNVLSTKMSVFYNCLLIIFFLIFLFDWYNDFKSIISPTIFKVIIPVSYFSFFDKKNNKLRLLLSIIIMFLLGERTVSLIFLFILITTLKPKKINSSSLKIIGIATIIVTVGFPLFYVYLGNSDIGIQLNSFIYQYTGENLFSGRNLLWEYVFEGLSNHYLIGLSFGNNLFQNMDIVLSTHNLFVWLLLCGGIILLTLSELFMNSIINDYKYIKSDKLRYTSAVYFIAINIMCSLDLLLFTNNFVISIIMWIVTMLPLSIEIENNSNAC